MAEAVADTIGFVQSVAGGRLNLVLTDGRRIVATRSGDALSSRRDAGAVHLASEPFDDDPAWQPVPDHHLIDVTVDSCTVTALP